MCQLVVQVMRMVVQEDARFVRRFFVRVVVQEDTRFVLRCFVRCLEELPHGSEGWCGGVVRRGGGGGSPQRPLVEIRGHQTWSGIKMQLNDSTAAEGFPLMMC